MFILLERKIDFFIVLLEKYFINYQHRKCAFRQACNILIQCNLNKIYTNKVLPSVKKYVTQNSVTYEYIPIKYVI